MVIDAHVRHGLRPLSARWGPRRGVLLPGGASATLLQKYVLSTCLIVSFHQTAPQNGVVDEIQMSFAVVKYSFSPQKSDGSLGTPITVTWDIRANKVS